MINQPAAEVGWFKVKEGIDVTTRVVLDNEPCFFLGEFDLPSKSGKTKSRYQLLRVVRDDRLVTAYVYLGPSATFTADQFTMVGGWFSENGKGYAEHTVAQMQEGATELRSRPQRRELEPSDLQGAFRNMTEEKGRRVRNQSSFGYKGQLVRA